MDNKNLGDIMMLLNYSINKDSFSFENIRDKLCNQIFGLKLYEDGCLYSGFLDQITNEIIHYAIYKDSEGRLLKGKFTNYNCKII